MPDTIDRITLNSNSYVDAYTLTGLSVGTPLTIQSHSTKHCRIHIGSTQPPTSTEAFVVIPPDFSSPVYVELGASGCWLLGDGPLSIQEDT